MGIGASVIDRVFMRMVQAKVMAFLEVAAVLPPDYPVRLSSTHQFWTLKHKFGVKVYMKPVFRIPVEGVAHDFTHPGLGIENGRILFTM